MADLYKGIAGSPITYLSSDISAAQTTISIADDSALPDAPNICTIGYGEQLETIKYETKSNGVLQNVTRGIEGTPRAWPAGTEVARFFTAYDHNSIIENFNSHLAESVLQVGGVHGLKVEEGEWNPVVYAGNTEAVNAEYSANGNYYRIGNYVNCQFYLNITDRKSYVGALNIRGLPFVVKNATPTAIGETLNITFETDWININVSPITGTSDAYIKVIRNDKTMLNFPLENLMAGNRIFNGAFSYYI